MPKTTISPSLIKNSLMQSNGNLMGVMIWSTLRLRLFRDGPKSSIHEIAEVIRKALNEKKCLFCHYDAYERFSELLAVEDEESNKMKW